MTSFRTARNSNVMAGIAATDMHAGIEMNHTLPEREFFIDNLLVRIHLIIVMVLVDRPCAMGV